MNATVGWAANVESDLAGYLVYHGITPGVYYESFTVLAPTTTKVFTGLYDLHPHYFAVSAYDDSGNESGLSAVMQKQSYIRKVTQLLKGATCG